MMSGINLSHIQKLVIDEFNKNISEASKQVPKDARVTLVVTHLNTDRNADLIATIDAPEACGTGGCIPNLMIKSAKGEFEIVRFGYAVKSIEVVDSVTEGMHDLRINGDLENLMTWNGKQYIVQSY